MSTTATSTPSEIRCPSCGQTVPVDQATSKVAAHAAKKAKGFCPSSLLSFRIVKGR